MITRRKRMGRCAAGRTVWDTAFFMISIALASAGSATASRAGIVAEDTISYPDGSLWGRSGGSGWVTAWNGYRTDVVNQEAVGGPPNEFAATRSFDHPFATQEMFIALTLRTPAKLGLADSFEVQFLAGVNGGSLRMGKVPGDDRFVVGNGGWIASDLVIAPGTTYRLVGGFDVDASRVSLWVNPDGSDFYEPASGANSADASGITSVVLYVDRMTLFGDAFGLAFDDILIGDTPESVGLQSSGATGVAGVAAWGFAADGRGAGWTASAPNPCRDFARIAFDLPKGGPATLAMFDVHGRRLQETPLGVREAGLSETMWNADAAPAGVYFYEVRVEGARSVAGKLVVAR